MDSALPATPAPRWRPASNSLPLAPLAPGSGVLCAPCLLIIYHKLLYIAVTQKPFLKQGKGELGSRLCSCSWSRLWLSGCVPREQIKP